MKIQHCLLARCERAAIRKLYTHPQPMGQCRQWLQTQMPEVEIIETSSTTRAAELAAAEEGASAIAGALAAEHYGLNILESDIQDNAANATRFLVLGRQCSQRPARIALASWSALTTVWERCTSHCPVSIA